MQTPEGLTPGERELEMALRTVHPSDAGVDRAALAYRLGEVAGRRAAAKWQGATGAMVVALAGVLLVRTTGTEPARTDDRLAVGAGVPAVADPAGPVAGATETETGVLSLTAYARERERSLRMGDGAVTRTASSAAWIDEEVRTIPARSARDSQSGLELFLMALSAGRGL